MIATPRARFQMPNLCGASFEGARFPCMPCPNKTVPDKTVQKTLKKSPGKNGSKNLETICFN